MYKDFQSLLENVKGKGKMSMAVAAAHDETVLEAVKLAMQHVFLQPILVGDKALIEKILTQLGVTEAVEIIDQPDVAKAATEAVELVKAGRAHALMKGIVNTAVFLRAVLKKDATNKDKRFLSHLAAFEIPGQKKILFMTDVAFNTYPDLEQKRLLLINAITALHKLGYARPNVALLSANEIPSEKMPASIDAQKLVQMSLAGELPVAEIEGPMALDVIADAECAVHKKIKSNIAGDVDLVLAPDIEAGNGIAKAFSHYAGGTMSGLLVGGDVPVILNSRSDTARSKFISIALALLLK